MTPVPFKLTCTILVIYIVLFVILGFFSLTILLWLLGIMFAVATLCYIVILVEEKPWKYCNSLENWFGYALMAYGIVFFFLPIILLNAIADKMERNEK